jgi:hypothetical protein
MKSKNTRTLWFQKNKAIKKQQNCVQFLLQTQSINKSIELRFIESFRWN